MTSIKRSTVMPKCGNSASAGALAPKVSMPTTAPSRPTYLRQKSVTPASIATRFLHQPGSTLSRYSSGCASKTFVHGIETTRTATPWSASTRIACIARSTSDPVAMRIASNFVLPVVALCLPQIAAISRLTRASMIEVLGSNFVRTARAKGMPERITITRHAIRAAMLPVVSYLGPAIAQIITGSVVVEQIFGIPGIGRYFVQSSLNRDYTMVMGVTIFYGALVIFCNLVADILYGVLDPKVRYD